MILKEKLMSEINGIFYSSQISNNTRRRRIPFNPQNSRDREWFVIVIVKFKGINMSEPLWQLITFN